MTYLQPRNILVMILGQLGDVVLALPALSAIRVNFPEARISVLAATATREILEVSGVANEVIPVDRGALRKGPIPWALWQMFHLVREIRRQRFDLVIDLHSLYETNILGFLSGSRTRLFANRENRSIDRLSNVRPRPPIEDKSLHKSVYYLDVLGPIGVKGLPSYRLPVPPEELPENIEVALGSSKAAGKRLVGLFVGAGHPGRKWRLDRFAELSSKLSQKDDAQIFVILGPEEDQLAQTVEKTFPPSTVVVHNLSIRQLLVVLSRLDLFLGNDTGPSHLASAIGTPTIMIMRSDYDRRFTPFGEMTKYVASGPVSEITVVEAYDAAKKMLSATNSLAENSAHE